MRLEKTRQAYRMAAVIWLNTTLLLAAMTISGWLLYGLIDAFRKPKPYSSQFRPDAIASMQPSESLEFFKEFDRLERRETFQYQPWLGFSERVYHSPRLNVDESAPLPHRRTVGGVENRLNRKSRKVIWLFGGSTMFGWGVPDDQTVASHLQQILSERFPDSEMLIENHGHCYFYSSQEVLLFQQLLRSGKVCDLAVFLDGLNELNPSLLGTMESPAFADRAAVAFENEQRRSRSAGIAISVSPMFPPVRLVHSILYRSKQLLGGPKGIAPAGSNAGAADANLVSRVCDNYQFNIKLARASAGLQQIDTVFFWQPTPFELLENPLPNADRVALNAQISDRIEDAAFHSIAAIFTGERYEATYVDFAHYGDRACRRVAEAMAEVIVASDRLRESVER